MLVTPAAACAGLLNKGLPVPYKHLPRLDKCLRMARGGLRKVRKGLRMAYKPLQRFGKGLRRACKPLQRNGKGLPQVSTTARALCTIAKTSKKAQKQHFDFPQALSTLFKQSHFKP